MARLSPLVWSQSPDFDREKAREGHCVVLSASADEIRILTYDHETKCWYVLGYQSVDSAAGKEIPDADFYFRGVGYVNDASIAYAMLVSSSPAERWLRAYASCS